MQNGTPEHKEEQILFSLSKGLRFNGVIGVIAELWVQELKKEQCSAATLSETRYKSFQYIQIFSVGDYTIQVMWVIVVLEMWTCIYFLILIIIILNYLIDSVLINCSELYQPKQSNLF